MTSYTAHKELVRSQGKECNGKLKSRDLAIFIQRAHVIQVRRPDIMVKSKEICHTWLTAMWQAVPGVGRVEEKEIRENIKNWLMRYGRSEEPW